MDIESVLSKYYKTLREESGIDWISISFHFEWDDKDPLPNLIIEASNKFVKLVTKDQIRTKNASIGNVRLIISKFVEERGDQLVSRGVVKKSIVGLVSSLLGYDNMYDRVEDMLIFVRN